MSVKHETRYCFTEVDIGLGYTLWIDGNSKITASAGTFEQPMPNALSLPDVGTCPGSTPSCRAACYVQNLRKYSPDTYAKYVHNERTLHVVLANDKLWAKSSTMLAAWIDYTCNEFRWHVSGDVFSHDYADWIARVCLFSPEVNHWIYTRSGFAVATLLEAPNLVVNLSADKDNLNEMRDLHSRWPERTRICWMANDTDPKKLPMLPDDSVIFVDYPNRGREMANPREHQFWQGMQQRERRMVCVADFFGQSPNHRCGVCKRCMVQPRLGR